MTSSPLGLHRVREPGPGEPGPADPGGGTVLPQAAWRLDPDPRIQPDEVRADVERLNLDAASFRQIRESTGGAPGTMRAAVLGTIRARGKMHNPVTGSGGMLTGVVAEAGPRSPLGLRAGMRIATLVSLSLTPLAITDGLARWDGQSEQIPCEGHAILFARSIAVPLPGDLPAALALAVFDVCGAPALTRRVVTAYREGRGFGNVSGDCPVAQNAPARTPGARAGRRHPRCGREERLAVGRGRPRGRGGRDHRRGAQRRRGRHPARIRPRRRDRAGRRAGSGGPRRSGRGCGWPGRRDRRLRRRARLRGRRDPGHRLRRDGHLLLHGHVVQRGGARRRGDGRRRDHADRQRVRPRSRRAGPEPHPPQPCRPGPVRASRFP